MQEAEKEHTEDAKEGTGNGVQCMETLGQTARCPMPLTTRNKSYYEEKVGYGSPAATAGSWKIKEE